MTSASPLKRAFADVERMEEEIRALRRELKVSRFREWKMFFYGAAALGIIVLVLLAAIVGLSG